MIMLSYKRKHLSSWNADQYYNRLTIYKGWNINMSTLKVDAIRHNSATSDAITTASDGTCTAKLTSINGGMLSSER